MDDLTGAPALGTGGGGGEGEAARSTLDAHLAGAVAVGADLRGGAAGTARAVAGGAVFGAVEADLLLHASHGLLKGDGHVHPQRSAPLGGVGVGLALTAAKPAKAAAEEGAEDVAQVHVAHVEPTEAAATKATGSEVGVHPGVTKLVILGPLVLVGQHLVGLVDLLELRLRLCIARVQVGVILLGQLAVGLFQFIVRGGLGHAQDLIIVTFLFCHCMSSPHWAG